VRRNRVTPLGAIVASPARGLVFGNRGCLHDADGVVRRRYAGRAWIACRLEFKDRRRPLLQPGRYTELFFLDDATALAAGHRPCAECRREDYNAFRAAWPSPGARAPEIDRVLHDERLGPRTQADVLPDGAFVLVEDEPWLVHGDVLRRWTAAGYDRTLPRPPAATLITPPSTVAALAAGWAPTAVPLFHPSARGG
jgi:hypothetical protein